MPYIEGRWGKIGLELGEAQAKYQREKAYQADKHQAFVSAQEELERERTERKAGAEAFRSRLDVEEEDITEQMPGALGPGEEGPITPEEARVHDRFARIRKVADNLSPENRERWLLEEHARLRQGVFDRARKKVAEGIQDRYKQGGFTFLDDTEPNEAIEARVEQLMQALDSDQIDPLAAAEVEAQLLETVRKENQERLEFKRGSKMIEDEVLRATDSGNSQLSEGMEALQAMWMTRELKPADLIDKIFELKYGRKTERAAKPNAFDIRKEAIRLWENYEKGPPTEEGLRKYMELLHPSEEAPAPTKKEVVKASTSVPGARGTETDPRLARAPRDSDSGKPTRGGPDSVPPDVALAGRRFTDKGKPVRDRGEAPPRTAKAEAKGETKGGKAPRPWPELTKSEKTQAERDLMAVATKGGDLRKALKSIGVSDPDSLPDPLTRRLIELAKNAGGPTLGEAVSHRRPGAGGM